MTSAPQHHSGSTRLWQLPGGAWQLGVFPKLMGIVNVTPDSFSDGGNYNTVDAAVAHALQLVKDGADILDIGGESTRPGASSVSLDDELARVIPVIEKLAGQTSVPISIDTTKAEVARQAVASGAVIINDISGMQFDPTMIEVCRDCTAGLIAMHIQGTPQTMQQEPHYENVVSEITDYFRERLGTFEEVGIAADRVLFDPGVGFGKTAAHNVEILSHIEQFRSLGRPVLIGHSRKRFLKAVLGREVEERLSGTVGVSIALAMQHTDILRVHDVQAVRDALIAWDTIRQAIPGVP